MRRGIRFQITNEYGKYIAEILEPIDCTKYNWKLESSTEIWKVANGKLNDDLFDDANIVEGKKFNEVIRSNIYYMIFATIKAYPIGASMIKINTYEEFLISDCAVCLLVADCSYVDVYCKDIILIEKLYDNAKIKNYEHIEYIDEDDSRTVMYV